MTGILASSSLSEILASSDSSIWFWGDIPSLYFLKSSYVEIDQRLPPEERLTRGHFWRESCSVQKHQFSMQRSCSDAEIQGLSKVIQKFLNVCIYLCYPYVEPRRKHVQVMLIWGRIWYLYHLSDVIIIRLIRSSQQFHYTLYQVLLYFL